MTTSFRILKSTAVREPSLSVLVRVKNESHALPEFWARLSSQTLFPATEVLFLDSGSTDGTLELIGQLPAAVYTIRPEEFRFGSSCNLLLARSRAPVACFLSGHVFLEHPDALQRLHSVLSGQRQAAAYLRQVPDTIFGANSYERAFLARRYPAGKCSLIEMEAPSSFSNAASGLTRYAWERNPFPDIHGSEDFAWAEKHLAQGGKIFYLPTVTAMHSHRESPAAVYERVRLNARARGVKGSYVKASYFWTGILLSMLRHGATWAEALKYATSHARAYAPRVEHGTESRFDAGKNHPTIDSESEDVPNQKHIG